MKGRGGARMVQAEVWLSDPIESGTYGRIAGCRYICV